MGLVRPPNEIGVPFIGLDSLGVLERRCRRATIGVKIPQGTRLLKALEPATLAPPGGNKKLSRHGQHLSEPQP
jgi:hypothetical protein